MDSSQSLVPNERDEWTRTSLEKNLLTRFMMPTKDRIRIPYINIESLITVSAAINQEYPIDPKARRLT